MNRTTNHHSRYEMADGVARIGGNLQNLKEEDSVAPRLGASEDRQSMHDSPDADNEMYRSAKDMVREGYVETLKAADIATISVRNVVTDHPFAAVGIAVGAGALLGSVLVWRLRSS
jgi:ElaB/YqjD/DUF883 family membrane-anchored ribosome-binding protein